jgi:hypothetical protein
MSCIKCEHAKINKHIVRCEKNKKIIDLLIAKKIKLCELYEAHK